MPVSAIYPQQVFRAQPNMYPSQQVPGMSLNMPIGLFQQPQKQSNELIGLHGLDSAKQYPMSPNTTVPTFDLDSDHAFILDADANGVVSIKILKFHVVTEEEYRKETESETPIQITKGEYDDLSNRVKMLEEELENAKQLIQTRVEPSTKPDAGRSPAKPTVKSSVASDGANA